MNLAKYLKTPLVAASEILSNETCSSVTVYILLSHGTSIIFSSLENLFFSFFKALFNVSARLLSLLTLESSVFFQLVSGFLAVSYAFWNAVNVG